VLESRSMEDNRSQEQLIAEAITPVRGTMAAAGMARGEPGLPMRFAWRGREYAVAEVLGRWKETGPCHHGSGERYVRKHWFEFRTEDGCVMKVYFERQPRSAREKHKRWWLHTVVPPPPPQ